MRLTMMHDPGRQRTPRPARIAAAERDLLEHSPPQLPPLARLVQRPAAFPVRANRTHLIDLARVPSAPSARRDGKPAAEDETGGLHYDPSGAEMVE